MSADRLSWPHEVGSPKSSSSNVASIVLAGPKPVLWLTRFGDDMINGGASLWTTGPDAGVGNVWSILLDRLWLLVSGHKVELLFPQRDIHDRSLPCGVPEPA